MSIFSVQLYSNWNNPPADVLPTLHINQPQAVSDMRFAIGFDNETPQVVDILADNDHSAWQESVKDGVRYAISQHHIAKPGAKKLRIYMVDPAVTIQKVIINTGELKPSYLGPPPSRKL